jgi:uncharacterized protein (DUF433 family)
MNDWQDRINIDPKILGGKPVIAGTRIPVQVIVGALAGGMTIDEVVSEWRVSREDVLAALSYAEELLADETVHALPRRLESSASHCPPCQ